MLPQSQCRLAAEQTAAATLAKASSDSCAKILQQGMDWARSETLNAYSFHADIQYALNLEPVAHDLSMRTLERYVNVFE